jgi:hypothetical protein
MFILFFEKSFFLMKLYLNFSVYLQTKAEKGINLWIISLFRLANIVRLI